MDINPNRTARPTKKNRGSAAVEFAIVAPLICFLAVTAFDLGLRLTAMTAVENAARAAAARNSGGIESASDQETACAIALSALRGLPSIPSTGTCASSPLLVQSVLCD